MSFVDLNRSGVALMEIVSKPDMRSSEEAKAFLSQAALDPALSRHLRRRHGEGQACAPTSTSRCASRASPLGTRCEIKNVNSIRFIGQAIEHEARRQIEIIEDGGTIDQETRLFDPDKGETRSMRSKEEAHDYRYFPDPDLLPLEFDQAYVDELEAASAGTAGRRRRRASSPSTACRAYDADVLVAEKALGRLFRGGGQGPRRQGRRQLGDQRADRPPQQGRARASRTPRSSPAQLGAVLDLIGEGTISGKIAKDLFEIVWSEGGDPRAIVEQRGMKQVTDTGAIEKVVDEIIAANPDKVARGEGQARTLLGWFVGQVMKATGGKANPQAVNELLKGKLGDRVDIGTEC